MAAYYRCLTWIWNSIPAPRPRGQRGFRSSQPRPYRNVTAPERGLSVDHTTVWRWTQRYAPEIECRATWASQAEKVDPAYRRNLCTDLGPLDVSVSCRR